jgi:hypothetical protein
MTILLPKKRIEQQKIQNYTSSKRLFYAKLIMDKEFYTCLYCFKDYEPKRRRVQKYCSSTCRSKACHARKTSDKQLTNIPKQENGIKAPDFSNNTTKTKIESVSAHGIGNATIGTLAADGLKSLFTSQENKPATKGDLKNLTNKIIKRYHLVKNIPKRLDGALPYFDIETNEVIYSIFPL